jgi:hypothetical protein
MATRPSPEKQAQPRDDRPLSRGSEIVRPEAAGIACCLVAPPVPDEALISVVGRVHILSCNGTTTATFRELFDSAPFNLSAWIPPHIEKLARRLGNDVTAHALDILRAHTLYPLLAMLSGLSYPTNSPRRNPSKAASTPKRLSAETTRLCIACLREDMDTFGIRYIHRSHQLPGVEVCSKHGTALLSRCPYCRRLFGQPHDLVLAPWRRCTCKRYIFEESASAEQEVEPVALSYAKFSAALLASRYTTVSPGVLVKSYRERARESGYRWGSDRVSHTRLMTEMEHFYGKAFLSRVDTAYREERISEWLKMLHESSITEPPLGRHLLFAHFLFRDAAQFLDAVAAREEADTDTLEQPALKRRIPKVATTKAVGKPSAQQRIAGLLLELTARARDIPDCSLEDLWGAHYGLMKRLVSLDPAMVDVLRRRLQQLKPKPAVPTKVSRKSPKDRERARYIAAIAATLYASVHKPEKVTINRLVKGLGWNPSTLDPHAFPATLRALEECSESNWHFYARRIIWAMLSFKHAAIGVLRLQAGVEYHRFRALMDFFGDVDVSRQLDAGTITALLAERSIQRGWAGPCPDREFPPAGRSFYVDQ